MSVVLKQAWYALRGLIAAAGFVGAGSILYTWAAPWIVWIGNHWQEISSWLFDWVQWKTTESGRFIASFMIIFIASGIALPETKRLIEGKRSTSEYLFGVAGVVIGLVLVSQLRLHDDYLKEEMEFLTYVYMCVFIFLSFMRATAFTTWFTVWVGAFFLLDYAYRHEWHKFFEVPA